MLLDDTDVPRTLGNCKQDQQLYSGTRFNETYNYPYWSTDSISSVVGISDAAFNAKTWAPAEAGNPAVVKMYQPNGWGSWAFEVSEISPVEADAGHEAGTRSIKVWGANARRATRAAGYAAFTPHSLGTPLVAESAHRAPPHPPLSVAAAASLPVACLSLA